MMDQLIPFHKLNKKVRIAKSNQTPYLFLAFGSVTILLGPNVLDRHVASSI